MKKLLFITIGVIAILLIIPLLLTSAIYGQSNKKQKNSLLELECIHFEKGKETTRDDSIYKPQHPSKYIIEKGIDETIKGELKTIKNEDSTTPYSVDTSTKDTSVPKRVETTDKDSSLWKMLSKAFAVGVRGGLNFPSMLFDGFVTPIENTFNGGFDRSQFKTGFVFGLFIEFKGGMDSADFLDFRPELLFIRRGFDGKYVKPDNTSIYYNCEENFDYLEGRFSFLFRPQAIWIKNESPYRWLNNFHISLAGYADWIAGGSVYENSVVKPAGEKEQLKVGKNGHVNAFDVGVGIGAGFKIPITSDWFNFYICGDVSFDFGLLDNHPIREIEQGNPARYNRGTIATVGLSIPLYQPTQKIVTETTINTTTFSSRTRTIEKETERVDTIKISGEKITQIDTVIKTIKTERVDICTTKVFDTVRMGCPDSMIIVWDELNFIHSKYELTSELKKALDSIINVLNTKHPDKYIAVYGHTDSSGSPKYPKLDADGKKSPVYDNLSLSQNRAEVIANYLKNNGLSKIDGKERIKDIDVTGYGYMYPYLQSKGIKPKPKCDGEDCKRGVNGWDRRVEIYIKCFENDWGRPQRMKK